MFKNCAERYGFIGLGQRAVIHGLIRQAIRMVIPFAGNVMNRESVQLSSQLAGAFKQRLQIGALDAIPALHLFYNQFGVAIYLQAFLLLLYSVFQGSEQSPVFGHIICGNSDKF